MVVAIGAAGEEYRGRGRGMGETEGRAAGKNVIRIPLLCADKTAVVVSEDVFPLRFVWMQCLFRCIKYAIR
jgi:hypothetical protein